MYAFEAYKSKNNNVKEKKNLSRVFLGKHTKKILEETWRNWVSKLNSRLSFYYCLPAVEKCLDKSLRGYDSPYQLSSWRHGSKYPEKLMIKELSGIQIGSWIVKYVCIMFIALVNLISTSWMHLYQIDLSSNKEFQNVSIFLL